MLKPLADRVVLKVLTGEEKPREVLYCRIRLRKNPRKGKS